MKSGILAVSALILVLSACGDKLQTREAVERGVLKGVAARGINANSMDVSVTSVRFHGKQADAVVAFAPKGGKLSDGLTMRYTLEQRDSEWVITQRAAMDIKQHTGGMESAPSMMDQNSGADTTPHGALPGAALPGSDRPLPAGHPPIDGTPK